MMTRVFVMLKAPIVIFVNPCVLTFLSTQFWPPISKLRELAPEDGGLSECTHW